LGRGWRFYLSPYILKIVGGKNKKMIKGLTNRITYHGNARGGFLYYTLVEMGFQTFSTTIIS
jgi:hypothetical protein